VPLKRARWLLGLLLLLCMAGAGYYFLVSARTPAGQPPLTSLHRSGFDGFEQVFDDAANRIRVVVMLSPS